MRQQKHLHGPATAEADPGRVEGARGFNPARAGIESLRQQKHIHGHATAEADLTRAGPG